MSTRCAADRDLAAQPAADRVTRGFSLAIQAYKHLEAGDATIPQLKHALGREVTESAVLRAHYRTVAATAHHSCDCRARAHAAMQLLRVAIPEGHR